MKGNPAWVTQTAIVSWLAREPVPEAAHRIFLTRISANSPMMEGSPGAKKHLPVLCVEILVIFVFTKMRRKAP